jgi:hypothetical protein
MFIKGNIQGMFNGVNPQTPEPFQITRPRDVKIPAGANTSGFHQQGIQKTTSGEFVITGSAKKTGYIYKTSPAKNIETVIEPVFWDINQKRLNHLGGFQIAEDIIAVGYERLANRRYGTSKILFYNAATFETDQRLTHLTLPRNNPGDTAGAVGLSRFKDTWLLLVANWDSERLDFYISDNQDLLTPQTSFPSQPNWSWSIHEDKLTSASVDKNWSPYQSINLFVEANQPDIAWFIGMHTSSTILRSPDWADLYKLEFTANGPKVTKKANMYFPKSSIIQRFNCGSGYYYNHHNNTFEVYNCAAKIDKTNFTCHCLKWS